MAKVTLYSTKRRIALTLDGTATANWNYPMNSPDFRVYKGSQTDVEFVVRNVDRKPVPLATISTDGSIVNPQILVVTLVDHRTKEVYLQKEAVILDAAKGLIRVTLTPMDVMHMPLGFLSYTVSIKTPEGALKLLYVDQYEHARGNFEVLDGALPAVKPTVVLPEDRFLFDSSGYPMEQYRISGAIDSRNDHGFQTFAVYGEGFNGKFWVEGCLSETIEPQADDWFTLPLGPEGHHVFKDFTGIQAFNVEANINWIRFRYLPEDGRITQVLFRN